MFILMMGLTWVLLPYYVHFVDLYWWHFACCQSV